MRREGKPGRRGIHRQDRAAEAHIMVFFLSLVYNGPRKLLTRASCLEPVSSTPAPSFFFKNKKEGYIPACL